MIKKSDRRQLQMEKQIKECLASYLLKNFNLSTDGIISVTRVQIPKDFKTAKVYVHQLIQNQNSIETSTTDAEVKGEVLSSPAEKEQSNQLEELHESLIERLEKNAGNIQRYLSHELKLRFCPRLQFFYDKSFEKTIEVDKLIFDMTRAGAFKTSESAE